MGFSSETVRYTRHCTELRDIDREKEEMSHLLVQLFTNSPSNIDGRTVDIAVKSGLINRSLPVTCVSLCSAMDLIATSSTNRLIIFRTISWEIVYRGTLPTDESVEVTCLSFCPYGKALAIGTSIGNVFILDIEGTSVCSARNSISTSIESVAWHQNSPSDYPQTNNDQWRLGGQDQAERVGMYDIDNGSSGAIDSSMIRPITQSASLPTNRSFVNNLSSLLLLVTSMDGTLVIYVLGLYPVFKVATSLLSNDLISYQRVFTTIRTPQIMSTKFSGPPNLIAFLLTCNQHRGVHTDITASIESTCSEVYKFLSIRGHTLYCYPSMRSIFSWRERVAALQCRMERSMDQLIEMLSNCAKQWRDACKVVLPKLSLLEGVLNSYQLDEDCSDPVKFYYSVVLCGLWHPAASASFTQHWSEQGLSRFIAGVDSAAKNIIKSFALQAIPLANNFLLDSRELLALLVVGNSGNGRDKCIEHLRGSFKPVIMEMVQLSESLLLGLEEGLMEARSAREGMLLFAQFIKDFSAAASATESKSASEAQKNSMTNFRSAKYVKLFDPRNKQRPPWKGSHAQAEYVSGTRLYAYLVENSDNFTGDSSAVNKSITSPLVQEILSSLDKLQGNKCELLNNFQRSGSISICRTARELKKISGHQINTLLCDSLSEAFSLPENMHEIKCSNQKHELQSDKEITGIKLDLCFDVNDSHENSNPPQFSRLKQQMISNNEISVIETAFLDSIEILYRKYDQSEYEANFRKLKSVLLTSRLIVRKELNRKDVYAIEINAREVRDEPYSDPSSYVSFIDIDKLINDKINPIESDRPKEQNLRLDYTDAKMAFYCTQSTDSMRSSLLLCIGMVGDDGSSTNYSDAENLLSGVYLFEIDLSKIAFQSIAMNDKYDGNSFELTENKSGEVPPIDSVSGRKLPFKCRYSSDKKSILLPKVRHFSVEAKRGIVFISEQFSDRIIVIDMESEEDDDD